MICDRLPTRVALRGDNNRDRLAQLERLMSLVAELEAETHPPVQS